MAVTLGERIKAAREAKGVSISWLALRAGVTEDALRKIESGNVRQPGFSVGSRIAKALGINPFYLSLGDESYRHEAEPRYAATARVEIALEELERLLMQISALGRLASSLEDQARAALQRIAQGS